MTVESSRRVRYTARCARRTTASLTGSSLSCRNSRTRRQRCSGAIGLIYKEFSSGSGRRDGADPFVIAEAQARGLTVVHV